MKNFLTVKILFQCSATCGMGEQTVLYLCEEDGEVRPREECADIPEPRHSKQCYSHCDWKTGPWEPVRYFTSFPLYIYSI